MAEHSKPMIRCQECLTAKAKLLRPATVHSELHTFRRVSLHFFSFLLCLNFSPTISGPTLMGANRHMLFCLQLEFSAKMYTVFPLLTNLYRLQSGESPHAGVECVH